MLLLAKLPFLPFSVSFDILFRHGGFAAFATAHGGGEEAMYQFWRIFFVSSPVGKIHSDRIGQWVEVMTACHIVQSLAHPAHTVYLLRPVRHEIPESIAAWAVAGGRGNQMLRPGFLIRAMLVFLPPSEPQSVLQREWFLIQEMYVGRSVRGWLQFADEVISNHFFTRYWWMQQREGPFYLLEQGDTMGQVIMSMALREGQGLKRCIMREESAKMTRQLEQAKGVKEWKASMEERVALEKRDAALKKYTKEKKAQPPPAAEKCRAKGKPDPKRTPLSSANKQEIERLTHTLYTKQTSTLDQIKSVLASMPVDALENNFRRVLCLVVSLGHQHPRIKWSIKLALHKAAFETGRSIWDIERELYRVMYRRDIDPLAKLVRLSRE